MTYEINFADLPGTRLFNKLLNYYRKNADLERGFRIIVPDVLPAEPQRGENCKLKALADAMLHAARKSKSGVIPLYKQAKFHTSLRELAKKNGSVVGEIYSIEMLRKTCSDAGYESEVYSPENPDDYVQTLERLVDANQAPMVFFDMDLGTARQGLPYIGDGNNEHASVVVGYYKNVHDETHFIVTQWGRYYDFDGMELALSSCGSLKDRREVETFSKYYDKLFDQTQWMKVGLHSGRFIKIPDVDPRTARPMQDTDTPLKGKIMVVTRPHSHDNPLIRLGLFTLTAQPLATKETKGYLSLPSS